ncbi:MAG: Bacterial Ig-like domain [Planctomycetota bacterium]
MGSARSFPLRLLLAALAAACARGDGQVAAEPFVVTRITPDPGGGPLLLNQQVTLSFSAPLDPDSARGDAFQVVDEAGRKVQGRVLVGHQSLTFEPRVPLRPELDDGSFRPDTTYRVLVAGYPRPGGLRAADGRMLQEGRSHTFRTVQRDAAAQGFPTPLLPVAGGTIPFVLQSNPAPQWLPLDQPRLRMQFTLPVLPSSLSLGAFDVALVKREQGAQVLRVEPATCRLVGADPLLGTMPGTAVELGFRRELRVAGTERTVALEAGDVVVVTLASGDAALRDWSDRRVSTLPGQSSQWWEVVAGAGPGLLEWPGSRTLVAGTDPLQPGLEVLRDGRARPALRVEAGDGSLGTFRPVRDTRIARGATFDRGDGTLVVDRDGALPFLAVDIPAGVTVEVDAREGALRLLACGWVRVEGTLLVSGTPVPTRLRAGELTSFGTLAEAAPVLVAAGGGIRVGGAIRASGSLAEGSLAALASAGPLDLAGSIPPATLLGLEPGARGLTGSAERAVPVLLRMTPGLPPGTELQLEAATEWFAVPTECSAARLDWLSADPGYQLLVQSIPGDPFRPERPDPRAERASAPLPVLVGSRVQFLPGGFLRVCFQCRVRGKDPLPLLHGLRLVQD